MQLHVASECWYNSNIIMVLMLPKENYFLEQYCIG